MPKANTLLHWNTLMPKEPIDHNNRVYIASHNCEGFIPHLENMASNIFLNHMDIIAMQETWLQPQLTFSTPFPHHQTFLRHRQLPPSDRPSQPASLSKGGAALFIHQDFNCRQIDTSNISIECLAVELIDISTCIICVYRPPNTPLRYFALQLDRLLHQCNYLRCIVLGDFNIDLLKRSSAELAASFCDYKQIVQVPTIAGRTLPDHIYM